MRDSFLKRDMLESSVRDEIIKEYIAILQKCFHVELIRPYHSNLRKELIKMPKAYFNDLGMRNILLEDFSPVTRRSDKGALLENYAFLRLRDKYGSKLNYWRTADGKEIDFIATRGSRPVQAYEVKFNGSKFKRSRYRKFTDKYEDVPFECVSYTGDGDSYPILRL